MMDGQSVPRRHATGASGPCRLPLRAWTMMVLLLPAVRAAQKADADGGSANAEKE